MKQYLDLLARVITEGTISEDRTGTGTKSIFGTQTRYDLSKGFPAVTTKKLYWHGIVTELLWFISGETNVKPLQDRKVKIWNEWADANGALGPVYGKQWRSWSSFGLGQSSDQLAAVIRNIKKDPFSRRHIVSAWNVGDLPAMALPPCHLLFQFYVRNGKLDCQLCQRSADLFLGVPFNIASYALLTHIVAHLTGLEVGEFVHTIGDAHVYLNHVKQAALQLMRKEKPLPALKFSERALSKKDIDGFKLGELESSDFTLENYEHHPAIKAPIAV